MHILFIISLVLITPFNTVWAADDAGNYAVWGVGQKTCFSYNKKRKKNEIDAFKHYTMGYLTATNVAIDETYSISNTMNLKEIMAWVDDYCEEKPMASYESVLINFFTTHFQKRSKRSSSDGGW